MSEKEILEAVMKKREFSELPKKDIERAIDHFKRRQVSDAEKVRLTRELLHKVFGAFGSKKLLSPKSKDPEWFLRKHLSTRERIGFYETVYERIIEDESVVFDLGAGINGFSYKYFRRKLKYIAIEAVGQWVELMNNYFKKEKIRAKAVHLSLFNLDELKKLIISEPGKKIVILFKVLDSLELLERNYSKKLLSEFVNISPKVVISFATESMIKRKKFWTSRKWITDYVKENFKILDDFETRNERFIILSKK